MIRPLLACLAVIVTLSITADAQAPPALTVVHAGPQGEVASLNDANEIMPGITEVLAYGTAVVVEAE